MKITVRQLKQLIKEQVEEVRKDLEIEEMETDIPLSKLPVYNPEKLTQKTFDSLARIMFDNDPIRNKVYKIFRAYEGKPFITRDGEKVEIGKIYVDEIGQTDVRSVDGKRITCFLSDDFYKSNRGKSR